MDYSDAYSVRVDARGPDVLDIYARAMFGNPPGWVSAFGWQADLRGRHRSADAPDLVGAALRGPKKGVDKATKGASLHP